MASKVVLSMKVEVAEDILRRYEEQVPEDQTVEQLMAKRLIACVDHNGVRGLYFNDEQRAKLEKLFGNLLPSADEALRQAENLATVKVGGVNVRITQDVLKRSKTRADAMRMPLEEWLEKEIAFGLETAVGLRG